MSRKTVGYVVAGLGILVILASVFADTLGLGTVAGFGWKQGVGVVVGLVLAGVGMWLATRRAS